MRDRRKQMLWAAVGVLAATIPAAAQSADGKTYRPVKEEQFYAACYIFTAGERIAYAFPPMKTNGEEMFYNLEHNLEERLLPLFPQHHNIRCMLDDTPEQALQRRSKYNYIYEDRPWPKGLPDGARPVYVEGMGRVPRDTITALGSAPTPQPAAAPKPASKPPQKPAQPAALTVKDDTSLRDAGKAWDEQVRKTLAAEAQKRAETAAKAAQADTKRKAEIEAFFAERRRQGSRQ